MGVYFRVIWEFKINNMGDVFHINTTSSNISCNNQLKTFLPEPGHYLITLNLC